MQRRHGIERLDEQIPRALPRHRTRLGHRLPEAWTVDEVGNEIDAAIVLAEVADLKQAWMRHLERAGFEEKPRPDGVPMRLVVALQHANRDRDTERAMRAAINQAAQPPATDQPPSSYRDSKPVSTADAAADGELSGGGPQRIDE